MLKRWLSRRCWSSAASAVLVLLAGGPASATDNALGSESIGARVVALEIRSEAPFQSTETLGPLVALRPGAELSERAVRETLLNLHASERVGRAEIRVATEGEGVRVFIVVSAKLGVRSIELEGDTCVRQSALKGRLQQVEGTPISESRVLRGLYRMEEILSDAGFRGGRVRLEVQVDEAAHQADIVYRIECGEPTLVESVVFTGSLGPFSAEELENELRLRPGKRLQRSLIGGERERVESWLIKAGYRLASVDGPVESSSASGGSVLEYEVDVGPRVEIVVRSVDQKRIEKKRILEVLDRERFDEALLLIALEDLRRDYQERGHYDVDIDWKRITGADFSRIEIEVDPGPSYALSAVTFQGNETVRADELAARMTTTASKALGSGGKLVSQDLEDDLANLRAHYARQGFAAAEVGPAEILRQRESLSVRIPVVEGQRQRLVSLEFVGVADQKIAESLSGFALSPGGPFHPRLLEETLDDVRAVYEQGGYLWAQVSAEVTGEPESGLRGVVVSVFEGPEVRVGRVVLRGNARTKRRVVLRTLAIEPGDTVNRALLLDAQRRLYRLGVFSQVEVKLAPGMPLAETRDVLVRAREGRSQRVTFGLGYDSEDGLRSLFGYSHSNLGHRAIAGRLDLRISEREEQFRALLRQPMVGRWPVPVTYSLFAVEEEQESFDSKRRGAQIEASRRKGASRIGLLFTYKLVEVLENPDVPLFRLGIDRNLREAEIASLTPSLLFDRRDDPLVPTRGWTLNLQGEYAFPFIAAEAEFTKLFGQYTFHQPLGRLGVLAASVRLGAIEPRSASRGDLEGAVPISEQFFAGGRTTHRAYRRDLLGVLGETLLLCDPESDLCGASVPAGDDPDSYLLVPVGGNGLALVNLDYRFPIVGAIGGTVFVDAGNVWAGWDDIAPSEAKVGIGVGLRYLSPIGPLRLEVGWKLDREVGESPSVVFLSFGNPF